MTSIFGTKEEILAQLERYRKFNEWEEANWIHRSPEESLAIADELYEMMTPEARMLNEDPEYHGFRYLLECLSRLK
jgi:hypothetical protein